MKLILTATKHLSLAYQLELAKNAQPGAIEAETVYAVSVWLEKVWEEELLRSKKTLPTIVPRSQALAWWQERIAANSIEGILSPRETAKQALAAFEVLIAWNLPLHVLEPYLENQEQVTFYHLAQDFKKFLQERHWILLFQVMDILCENRILLRIKELWLVGFDELTPQLQKFLKYVESTGISIQEQSFCSPFTGQPENNRKISKKKFKDATEEIIHIAAFAKEKVKEGKTVGVVSLSLEKSWSDYRYWFRQILQEEEWCDPHATQVTTFNLTYGQALDHYSLVQNAFKVLGLLVSSKERRSILQHLRYSPYIRKQSLIPPVPLIPNTPLSRFEWWQCWNTYLKSWGWPGERTLSSQDFQVLNKFKEVVQDWIQLDRIGSKLLLEQALEECISACHEVNFQPQSSWTPIQVLGLLESGGLSFDVLWISGLSSTAWPPQPDPNPFLPLNVQIQYQLPNASYKRQKNYATTILHRLFLQAKELVVSIAVSEGGRELEFSPLLPKNIEEKVLASAQPIPFKFATMVPVDFVQVPWTKEEPLKGVNTLLKLQATCPFKAYAVTRLGLKSPETKERGLNALEKGNILHAALEALWTLLGSSEKFLQYEPPALRKIIDHVLSSVLNTFKAKRTLSLSPTILSIEKVRLQRILEQWCAFERERGTFLCQALEEKRTVELLGHSFEVRIDRIDRVENESWIIDYKTGNIDLSYLRNDPSMAPQLPLYALSTQAKTLIYAQMMAGKFGFFGLSTLEEPPPKVTPFSKWGFNGSWEDLLSFWRSSLEDTLQAYLNGENTPRPKEGKKTCKQCHLQDVCRFQV